MAEQRNQTPAGDNTQWTTIIRPRTGWFDVDLEELWRYRDLIVMFVKRNFTVMYKQTILGPLWIILNPLITTVLFNVCRWHPAVPSSCRGSLASWPKRLALPPVWLPTSCPAWG